ncbi:type II secretion system protein GspM [Aestuariibacter salexigens]|uniref:type II secretion system protein GspM n=1 Tax=Aestuariibacter salexigens TaxID=226010 RepID=UPI00042A3C5B|nr:type II secretion system protein M [Aestuariibacter salexigens]
MDKLIAKFQALTEREQRLVIAAAAAIIVGIIYFGMWSPLSSAVEQNRRAVESQQSLLDWVQTQTNKAMQLRGSGAQSRSFSGSLPQAVNQTSARHSISISRMQPQGEELQVWVDQAPFNDVLAWLQALERRGVIILQADFAEADAPGLIRIRRLQLGKP